MTETHDVEFLLKVLDEHAQPNPRILEVACGGGRIAVPLARAGYDVTGIDADIHMLLRGYRKMAGLPNIRCHLADATDADWGDGYDVVVLAGNILINIASDMDYKAAQIRFIQNAAAALRPGGHLYLDFDLHHDPGAVFHSLENFTIFEGTDDLGTSGRIVGLGGAYDPVTQLFNGLKRWELATNSGESIVFAQLWHKHIPTQGQVYGWLKDAGLTIRRSYRNYTLDPLPEPMDESTHRAIIWAQKHK